MLHTKVTYCFVTTQCHTNRMQTMSDLFLPFLLPGTSEKLLVHGPAAPGHAPPQSPPVASRFWRLWLACPSPDERMGAASR